MQLVVFSKSNLHSNILHSDMVPVAGLRLFSCLVTGVILFESVSHGLGCFHHVLQFIRVRCRVALQIALL